MIRYKILLPVLTSWLLFGSSFVKDSTKQISRRSEEEDKWSGTVSYFRHDTGPELVFYEWKMDAIIKHDTIYSSQDFKQVDIHGDSAQCKGQQTYLGQPAVISIDEVNKEIYIDVPMPPCQGTTTHLGVREPWGATDETGIVITKQPSGNDLNDIIGTQHFTEGPDGVGNRSATTYSWHLVREKKKK